MPSELSGVIACLQEIELALLELKGKTALEGQGALEEVSKAARVFFARPSREQAQNIEALIRGKTTSGKAPGAAAFWETVTVDGHPATLAGLGQELAEVLEDLLS